MVAPVLTEGGLMRQFGLWLILGMLGGCAAEGELEPHQNKVPVANAGPDLTVAQFDLVLLTGNRSVDLDGDELTYRWSLKAPVGSAALLNNTNGIDTQFTADAAGDYVITLIVSDGTDDSPIDSVIVSATQRVPGENTAPIAAAGNDENVQRGTTVQLDGTGSSDADGDLLTFLWKIDERPSGSTAVLSSTSAPRPAFIVDMDGDYSVSLVVSDGQISSLPDTISISAFSDNTPPIANAGPDQTVALGSKVQLDASASSDADGDEISYLWRVVSKPNGSAATLSSTTAATPDFSADLEGAYVIELIANDGAFDSAPDALTITATKNNLPPVAHAGTNTTVSVGTAVVLSGSQSYDSNDDPLTYRWSWVNKPAGSTIAFSSATTMTPTVTPDVEGTYIAQLIVNDGEVDSASDSVTITATLSNVPPVAKAGADQAVTTGTLVTLDGGTSSDADANPLTYVWTFTSRPAGSVATLAASTTATPTFTADLNGTYVIQLIVNDGRVNSAPDSVVVSASTSSLPAPATEGDVIITEIMSNPDALGDATAEWFEIYNPTSTMWDLKNCILEDLGTNSHTISSALQIGPGEYRTLARSQNPGFTPSYVYSSFELGNSDDEIIITCNGAEIAQVAYSGSFSTSVAGKSAQLSTSAYDEVKNDSATNWCEGTMVYTTVGAKTDSGSPGSANFVCP
jgi:hypothetical protein